GVLFLVAVASSARPRLAAARGPALALAALVVAAALLNLAGAATPSLLGRDLNLYWDLRHLPSLLGLARESAGVWRGAVATALLLGALILVGAAAYWIWRKVLVVLADRRAGTGAAVFLAIALCLTAVLPAAERPLATRFGDTILRHAIALDRSWRGAEDVGGPIPGPAPSGSDLAALKRRDVYLVYIESYGTTVFDTPEFAAALHESLAGFADAVQRSGYTIASNRVVSPTFGGGSWLAH